MNKEVTGERKNLSWEKVAPFFISIVVFFYIILYLVRLFLVPPTYEVLRRRRHIYKTYIDLNTPARTLNNAQGPFLSSCFWCTVQYFYLVQYLHTEANFWRENTWQELPVFSRGIHYNTGTISLLQRNRSQDRLASTPNTTIHNNTIRILICVIILLSLSS